MKPQLSVIIPAYNEEKYIPDTLKSIRGQTRKPNEVLVVDGGSTDKTRIIAAHYGARVLIQNKRGLGLARQIGLLKANGDIVAFTDADTIVPPNWLFHIEQELAHKHVVGVFGSYRVKDGWAPFRYCANYINPFLFRLADFLRIPYAVGQNMAFKRGIGIHVGGFPVKFKSVEDVEMIRRLKKTGKVKYLKENWVLSSGRRGKEGFFMIPRKVNGLFRYAILRNAADFTFPDIR